MAIQMNLAASRQEWEPLLYLPFKLASGCANQRSESILVAEFLSVMPNKIENRTDPFAFGFS